MAKISVGIQIDDIVKLSSKSEYYKEWSGFTFRVIDVNYKDLQKIRLVRNMRNTKLGSTNHYILEISKNLKIHKKNKKYIADSEESDFISDIKF